jgi:thiamine kinase-like enzyme
VPLHQCPGSLLIGLAETIKAIQATPLFPALFPYLHGVDRFIEQFHALKMLPEQVTREHFQCYAKIQGTYPRHDSDPVSSHNDLNPGNIL